MSTALLIFIFLELWMIAAATARESLVISTVAQNPGLFCKLCDSIGFYIVELTTCSNIANLSRYSLETPDGMSCNTNATRYFNLTNIPTGSRVYIATEVTITYPFESISVAIQEVNGLDIGSFAHFFGFVPTYFISGLSRDCWPSRLVFDGSKVIDAFESNSSIAKSWAGRLPGRPPTSEPDISDWNIHYEALGNFPSTNSYAEPPVKFAAYECPAHRPLRGRGPKKAKPAHKQPRHKFQAPRTFSPRPVRERSPIKAKLTMTSHKQNRGKSGFPRRASSLDIDKHQILTDAHMQM